VVSIGDIGVGVVSGMGTEGGIEEIIDIGVIREMAKTMDVVGTASVDIAAAAALATKIATSPNPSPSPRARLLKTHLI
jgi:hypothetical protein